MIILKFVRFMNSVSSSSSSSSSSVNNQFRVSRLFAEEFDQWTTLYFKYSTGPIPPVDDLYSYLSYNISFMLDSDVLQNYLDDVPSFRSYMDSKNLDTDDDKFEFLQKIDHFILNSFFSFDNAHNVDKLIFNGDHSKFFSCLTILIFYEIPVNTILCNGDSFLTSTSEYMYTEEAFPIAIMLLDLQADCNFIGASYKRDSLSVMIRSCREYIDNWLEPTDDDYQEQVNHHVANIVEYAKLLSNYGYRITHPDSAIILNDLATFDFVDPFFQLLGMGVNSIYSQISFPDLDYDLYHAFFQTHYDPKYQACLRQNFKITILPFIFALAAIDLPALVTYKILRKLTPMIKHIKMDYVWKCIVVIKDKHRLRDV